MSTLAVTDVIAACLRSQLGGGVHRWWSDGEQDQATPDTLAQLVVLCLAAAGWVIVRRAEVIDLSPRSPPRPSIVVRRVRGGVHRGHDQADD